MNPQDAHFNPFPGLRPFQIEEKYLFFGRENVILGPESLFEPAEGGF